MFNKSIVALLIGAAGPTISAIKSALSDGKINSADILNIATAVITAIGVYAVPNVVKLKDIGK